MKMNLAMRLRRATSDLNREAFQERMPELIADLIGEAEARFDRLDVAEIEGADGVVQVTDHEAVEEIRDWIIDELLEISGRKASLK